MIGMVKKLLLLLFVYGNVAAQQYDVIIINGKIIDGTGNSWYYGDVAIKDGKIAAIGKFNNITVPKVINAKGLTTA